MTDTLNVQQTSLLEIDGETYVIHQTDITGRDPYIEVAVKAAEEALESATEADNSEAMAKASAESAQDSQEQAKISQDAAKISEDNSKHSELRAESAAEAAGKFSSLAQNSSSKSETSAIRAEDQADRAETIAASLDDIIRSSGQFDPFSGIPDPTDESLPEVWYSNADDDGTLPLPWSVGDMLSYVPNISGSGLGNYYRIAGELADGNGDGTFELSGSLIIPQTYGVFAEENQVQDKFQHLISLDMDDDISVGKWDGAEPDGQNTDGLGLGRIGLICAAEQGVSTGGAWVVHEVGNSSSQYRIYHQGYTEGLVTTDGNQDISGVKAFTSGDIRLRPNGGLNQYQLITDTSGGFYLNERDLSGGISATPFSVTPERVQLDGTIRLHSSETIISQTTEAIGSVQALRFNVLDTDRQLGVLYSQTTTGEDGHSIVLKAYDEDGTGDRAQLRLNGGTSYDMSLVTPNGYINCENAVKFNRGGSWQCEFNDTGTDDSPQTSYMRWNNSEGTRRGYVGYGGASENFSIRNDNIGRSGYILIDNGSFNNPASDVSIRFQTGDGGILANGASPTMFAVERTNAKTNINMRFSGFQDGTWENCYVGSTYGEFVVGSGQDLSNEANQFARFGGRSSSNYIYGTTFITKNGNGLVMRPTEAGKENYILFTDASGTGNNRGYVGQPSSTDEIRVHSYDGQVLLSNNAGSAKLATSGLFEAGQGLFTGGVRYPANGSQAAWQHSGSGSASALDMTRRIREHVSSTVIWEGVASGDLRYTTGTTGSGSIQITLSCSDGVITANEFDVRTAHGDDSSSKSISDLLEMVANAIDEGDTKTLRTQIQAMRDFRKQCESNGKRRDEECIKSALSESQ